MSDLYDVLFGEKMQFITNEEGRTIPIGGPSSGGGTAGGTSATLNESPLKGQFSEQKYSDSTGATYWSAPPLPGEGRYMDNIVTLSETVVKTPHGLTSGYTIQESKGGLNTRNMTPLGYSPDTGFGLLKRDDVRAVLSDRYGIEWNGVIPRQRYGGSTATTQVGQAVARGNITQEQANQLLGNR